MSQTQTSESEFSEEETIETIYQYAAVQMRGGMAAGDIRKSLQAKGLDPQSSRVVVDDLGRLQQDVRKSESQRGITHGAVWLVGGIAVTFMTWSSASSGGTQIVAWLAIIFGVYHIFRGITQSRSR
jgi:hypothetical protein